MSKAEFENAVDQYVNDLFSRVAEIMKNNPASFRGQVTLLRKDLFSPLEYLYTP